MLLNDVKNILKDKRLHLSLIATYIIGLVAHGYCYFNLLYSHDSMIVYQDNEYAWQISLGRFIAPLYCKIRGSIYAPALVGFLSLLFIALSVYIIVNLLDFKSKIQIVLVSAVMTTGVTVTLLNATYFKDVDIYMFSMLCALFGAYLINKYKFGFIVAPLFFVISLGGYQAQLQIAVFVIMILILDNILTGKETKIIIHRISKNLISLFLGLILYYLVTNVVLKITGIAMESNSYNGLSKVGNYGSLGNIKDSICAVYIRVASYFTKNATSAISTRLIMCINIAIFLIMFISLIIVILKKRVKGCNLVILIVLVLSMPFGINFVCFISQGLQHTLMMQSFVLVYVLALFISNYVVSLNIRPTNNKLIKFMIPAFIVMLTFNNVVYSNQTYVYKTLVIQNTEITFTRILDRVEQTDGYVVGETPVAIIGKLDITNGYRFATEQTGLNSGDYATTYYKTYVRFINNYLSYPMNILPQEKADELATQSYIENMTAFPAKDSVQMVDGTLIIKLSDVE